MATRTPMATAMTDALIVDGATDAVSWLGECQPFAITTSAEKGGGLPSQLVVEVWEIRERSDRDVELRPSPEGPRSCLLGSHSRLKVKDTPRMSPCVQLLGTVSVTSDTLLSSPPSRCSLPLDVRVSPGGLDGAPVGTATASADDNALTPGRLVPAKDTNGAGQPEIILRVTPQVGRHWASRAMEAAIAAKRAVSPTPSSSATSSTTIAQGSWNKGSCDSSGEKTTSVVFMTNAEGSARTWRAPVTPGNSIPRNVCGDILELTYASLPACSPQTPAVVVAPFSDVGVRLGNVWIGPPLAARHAIVAFRPTPPNDGQGRSNDTLLSATATEPPQEDELFMRTIAAETEEILRRLRARDMRSEQRKFALSRVCDTCDRWSRKRNESPVTSVMGDHKKHQDGKSETTDLPDDDAVYQDGDKTELDEGFASADDENNEGADGRAYGDLYRRFLGALEMALPGVSIYIGVLEGDGRAIRYVACTRTSSMVGKELERGEGISFSCVGPRYMPYVIFPPRRRGERCTTGSGPSAVYRKYATPNLDTSTANTTLARPNARSWITEQSPEEAAVELQRAFRGKLARDRLASLREFVLRNANSKDKQKPTGKSPSSALLRRSAQKTNVPATTQSPLAMPKMFDYDGRVGWPFVCIPLQGLSGSSSLGIIGMDTFEQMGSAERDGGQPEPGVVQMVIEAGR